MAEQKNEKMSARKGPEPETRPRTGERDGEMPPAKKLRPIQRAQREKMRLGDAFRREGLDERTVAQTWALVVERLRGGKSADAKGLEKLLVDVLKECDRILLEAPRAGGPGGNATPSVVHLYHNVPRPVREAPGAEGEAEAV